MSRWLLFISLAVASAAFGQDATPPPSGDFSAPPMVPVAPPPTPAAAPGSTLVDPNAPPATPPPPGTVPPPGYVPGQQGQQPYPYSPYGTPKGVGDEKPPVEWGYMVSESLFGMLTSAGVTLLPYFLLLRPMVYGQPVLSQGSDFAIDTVIFMLLFSTVPLAVMQTQISLANGSKYYVSESWPAALAGLGAQALVLGIFVALPVTPGTCSPCSPVAKGGGAAEIFLLVGSVALTPLIQMAVINLTKQPRMARVGVVTRDKKGLFSLGLPTLSPMVAQTRLGPSVGVQASLLNFSW